MKLHSSLAGKLGLFGRVALIPLTTIVLNADINAAVWNGLGGDNLWSNGANWDTGVVPTGSDAVIIYDIAASVSVVVAAGSYDVADFTAFANTGSGTPVYLTIQSGATLHSLTNFDVGYQAGPQPVNITIQSGATLDVDGYFLGNRPGPRNVEFAGILNIGGDITFSADTIINFTQANTGQMIIENKDYTSYFNLYWSGVYVTDRGHTKDDPGWGTIYGINATFDGVNTIITNVPEPSTYGLMFGSAAILFFCARSRRKTAASA